MSKARRKVAKPRPSARSASRKPDAPPQVHVRELLHELQVYTEEVEVQNEQLVKAQQDIEEARDRFADLYDFAPIGYLSLDGNGLITEINLSGAALFGRVRSVLLKLPLTVLAHSDDRDRLRRFLVHVIASEAMGPPPQIEIALKTSHHSVRLIARARREKRKLDILVAMLDVTQEHRLEQERQAALAREQARTAELAQEMAERIAAEERVKALLERLVGVQEDERRRLSRNLHDHLGQQLTALRLAIGSIKERTRGGGSGDSNSRIGVIEAIVSDLDRDIDRLAWDLRPAALDDMGLSAALATLVREWAAMTGVSAEFHATASPAPERRLGKDVESHVYRIVQEALTNVAKHAAASRVSVLLTQAREELALIVEDDGHGFPGGIAADPADGGMGLVSMRERAALIGGEIQIESLAGKGATVFVKIPLKPNTTS
ncbi:MAG: PAS domain-containing sensor histidine kinase [Cyanobacteria bacterium]|nr:PAS domain-containing sensor histidine kinase [Cyanobacteriota bacterium]